MRNLLAAAACIAGLKALFCAALASGTQPRIDLLPPVAGPVRLTGALAEVSGLAPASATSVYAHNDEQATIYEVDIRTGEVLGDQSAGRPPLPGDFEAIAVNATRTLLAASDGRLVIAQPTKHKRRLRFRSLDVKLPGDCEIEGMAPADREGSFFFACKHAGRRLVIYRWSAVAGAAKAIDVKLDKAVPNPKAFRATELVRDPRSGTLLVLDSAAGAVLEISTEGDRIGYWRLGGDHPQAEGLALMPDGTMVVADEGRIGDGAMTHGALTLYPPRR